MRDDIGTGDVSYYAYYNIFVIWQASWYDKLLERLRNLRKRSNLKLSNADDSAHFQRRRAYVALYSFHKDF